MNSQVGSFDYQKLANDLKEYRRIHSLSRRELAVIMGISTASILRIEQGEAIHLKTIWIVLGCINKKFQEYI